MFFTLFCASHIGSEDRFTSLQRVIRDNDAQTVKIPFFISVSSDAKFQDKVRDLAAKLSTGRTISTKIFVQEKQMSQFEHYWFLSNQIPEVLQNKTHVIFTDDDDFSPRHRVETYIKGFLLNPVGNREIIVCAPAVLKIAPLSDDSFTEEFCNISLIRGVDGSGRTPKVANPAREYVTYMVPASFLKKFCCTMFRANVIKTHMCDIVFGMLLNTPKIFDQMMIMYHAPWMYAYNQHNDKNTRMSLQCHWEYFLKTYTQDLYKIIESDFGVKFDRFFNSGNDKIYPTSAKVAEKELKKAIIGYTPLLFTSPEAFVKSYRKVRR
jgi:hypothetical protein